MYNDYWARLMKYIYSLMSTRIVRGSQMMAYLFVSGAHKVLSRDLQLSLSACEEFLLLILVRFTDV